MRGLGSILTSKFIKKKKNDMPTISQLIQNTRRQKKRRRGYRGLQGCPQRRGVCARVYVRLV